LDERDNILWLFLKQSIEGLGFDWVFPISESNGYRKDKLVFFSINADEHGGIFSTTGEVIRAKLSLEFGAIGLGKSAFDDVYWDETRAPLDVKLAGRGALYTICAGFKNRTEESGINPITRFDEESILIEREIFTGQERKDYIEVSTKCLRKIGIRERGILAGVLTAGQGSELWSGSSYVDSSNRECSCGHLFFLTK
jgi:hypothetical protein